MKKLSIDPGLLGTGYALWDSNKWDVLDKPTHFGVLKPSSSSGKEWVERSIDLGQQLKTIIASNAVEAVYCEFPMKFDSGVGGAASSGKVSDIGKLTFLVGVIAQVAYNEDAVFHPVPVNDWKGQLTKEIVAFRIAKRLVVEIDYYDSHANDAVGIGLWAKGFLHAGQQK